MKFENSEYSDNKSNGAGKKILVAVDFSDASINALKYAVNFAEMTNAEMNVITITNSMNYSPVSILGDVNNHVIDDIILMKNKLEKLVSSVCKNHSIVYKTFSMVGIPEIEIQKLSRKLKAEVIVMGQTTNSGMKKLLLGSTTSHVVNTSPIPVLIVPPKYKFKSYKEIVFAHDLNPENTSFLKDTVKFAIQFKSSITILNIDTEGGEDLKKKIQKMESEIMKRYGFKKIKGIIEKNINVLNGITEYIRKNKPDLVALVKYHPSLSTNFTTNTSSAKIADSLNVPVLVLESKK